MREVHAAALREVRAAAMREVHAAAMDLIIQPRPVRQDSKISYAELPSVGSGIQRELQATRYRSRGSSVESLNIREKVLRAEVESLWSREEERLV